MRPKLDAVMRQTRKRKISKLRSKSGGGRGCGCGCGFATFFWNLYWNENLVPNLVPLREICDSIWVGNWSCECVRPKEGWAKDCTSVFLPSVRLFCLFGTQLTRIPLAFDVLSRSGVVHGVTNEKYISLRVGKWTKAIVIFLSSSVPKSCTQKRAWENWRSQIYQSPTNITPKSKNSPRLMGRPSTITLAE